MDRVGQLRIWRAQIHFLSTAVVAVWSAPRDRHSLERGCDCFHYLRANLCGIVGVFIVTKARQLKVGGAVWVSLLCRKSLRVVDCLRAKRFCGTAGDRVV